MNETPGGLRLAGPGLLLREWTDEDLPSMVELFDEPAVAHRTPLASPFDLQAAQEYLAMIRRARASGERIHLAITVEGRRPCGEVLLKLTGEPEGTAGIIGYVLGSAYRGRGLARGAVRTLTHHAHHTLGVRRLSAQIEPDNRASIAVVEGAGYRLSEQAPELVADKGRSYRLLTWIHEEPRP